MAGAVLIVEDDLELSRLLQMDLKRNEYQVVVAKTGLEGLRAFQDSKFDLVLLDIALPLMDGLTVCRKIRETSNVPILMMTAHAVSEEEIAQGLDAGADEYMLKPMGKIEFHARVKALLRRAQLSQENQPQPITSYEDPYLAVDLKTRRVSVDENDVRLTPTEFKLLATFITRPGEVFSFNQLLENVWGVEYQSEHHYPRIYVSHLRRKIEPDPKNPTYIHNEYGVGYRFVPSEQSQLSR